jgi:hypothetical protein
VTSGDKGYLSPNRVTRHGSIFRCAIPSAWGPVWQLKSVRDQRAPVVFVKFRTDGPSIELSSKRNFRPNGRSVSYNLLKSSHEYLPLFATLLHFCGRRLAELHVRSRVTSHFAPLQTKGLADCEFNYSYALYVHV